MTETRHPDDADASRREAPSSTGPPLIGKRLGVYRIVECIGAGGMGEVYKAEDTRLGRSVAVKVLPLGFMGDPERLARFAREARVLASLSHPNIATIHGVEEGDGMHALVMELVEGETLADRLARCRTSPMSAGPTTPGLPLREVLEIARQIADALEAAHERGIVHRDLKPSNVMVTPTGVVKVLDFGLARSGASVPDGSAETVIATRPGVVVGTPAYMSPEQVRGDAVTTQSDVWAFGAVVYELLTGVSPFRRPTSTDTLAQVLTAEPDFDRLPPGTPASIAVLLRRCLEKDRRHRLHHMGDVRVLLEEVRAVPSSSSPGPVAAKGPRSGPAPLGIVAIGSAVIGGLAAWYLGRSPAVDVNAQPEPVRFSIPFVAPPTTAVVGERHVAISEDGRSIAYASSDRLWVRRMDEREPLAVAHGRAGDPFFSPRGDWLAFFSEVGGLVKVPVAGGPPAVIARNSDRPAGGVWRADGTIVFATSEGLFQVSQEGGTPRLLASPDRDRNQRLYAWPELLSDRNAVVFTIVATDQANAVQTALLDLDTLQSHIVLAEGSGARYLPSGRLVYASGPRLKAVRFDADTGRVAGEPATVGDIEFSTRGDNGAADFAVSASGTLVYLPPSGGDDTVRNDLIWLDRNGREEVVAIPPASYQYPRVSPDGSRVALNLTTGGNRDIWILNLERLTLTQLTDGPTEDILPVWNPAGDRVYYGSDRNGNFDIYSRAADGASPERLEFRAPEFQIPDSFTPDGKKLLVYDAFRDTGVLNLEAPERLEPLLHGDADERLAKISPDGRWVVYESNESGQQFEVFLRPFPDVGSRREQISSNGGRYPLWAPDGTEIFYLAVDGYMMSVPVSLSPTLSMGRPVRLFATGVLPGQMRSGVPFDISRVDNRFVRTRNTARPAREPTQVSIVLNLPSLFRDAPATK